MTKNEFIQHLEAPHYINEEDIVGLQDVLKEFPYCQSAQLLLTKAFHVAENLNFEPQLKKAAAFAGNRKKLHSLLFDVALTELTEKYTESVVEGIDQIEEVDSTDNSLTASLEVLPKDDVLEQQILVSAINSSILQEIPDSIPEEEGTISPAIGEVEVAATEPQEEPHTSFDDKQEHTFSEWLSFYGDKKEVNEGEESLLWQKTSEESKAAIHSFTESSTLPIKNEFYSASKMAKLSVQEDDDLVTETLATIYADQGNFEKAIKAFEKLQLKYPEKRVYFAGRIKEIENSLNS